MSPLFIFKKTIFFKNIFIKRISLGRLQSSRTRDCATPNSACSGSYTLTRVSKSPPKIPHSQSPFLIVPTMDADDANPETPKSTAALPKDGSGSQSSFLHPPPLPPPLPHSPPPPPPPPPPSSPPSNSADEARSNKQRNQREFILSVASKITSQSLEEFDSNVWGVLTAISGNARKRQQVFCHTLFICNSSN